jgi:hypothetical protein
MLRNMVVLSFLLLVLGARIASPQDNLATLISPDPETFGYFGMFVSGAGDVDGDGYGDVIVGAMRQASDEGMDDGGRAYVFRGLSGELLLSLSSPNAEEFGIFGYPVSDAGDVNNDGYDDVIVGALYEDTDSTDAGRAYVFAGPEGELLHTLVSPSPQSAGYFAGSVSAAGDVNNDGYDDVIVGAASADIWTGPVGEGKAYIFDGSNGNLLHTLLSPNPRPGCFGNAVSGIGDVDGDGHDDVIVGAWHEDADHPDAGRAHVFSGATGEALYTLISQNQEPSGLFGSNVSGVGDVNGDGYPDVAVGAISEDPGISPEDAGRAYVFSGPTGELIHSFASEYPEAQGWFCWIAGAGDVDQDGNADVIVGAPQEDPGESPTDAGRAYVFSGATGELYCMLISPNEEPGAAYGGWFGIGASGVGDWDGDGYDDVVVGAGCEDLSDGMADAGRAYVFRCDPDSDVDGVLPDPAAFHLLGPFPNPTAGPVRIGFQIVNCRAGVAWLSLYDVRGRCVDTVLYQTVPAGDEVTLKWVPNSSLSSGVYYWRLTSGANTTEKPMVLLR